jgi:aspartyl-tRNA(Asn)/glutamyl-tRNA(Gln) amidotransferase subunit B
VLGEGGEVVQETLHFDPRSGGISSLRSKEEAHDYRYFPEPDLVPLAPTERMLEEARAALPELPGTREQRYADELELPPAQARQLAYDGELGDFFEAALTGDGASAKGLANWITGEPTAREASPAHVASLVAMVEAGEITNQAGRDVLAKLVAGEGDPAAIVEREGLGKVSDSGELEAIVAAAIEAHPDEAEKVKAGTGAAIGPIVGHVMRENKGRADGGEVTKLIRAQLGL